MSGGFFRGTTADQDTRFSNKQAKLMKSQKFPPELEHLVDMTKVKIDVVRPWIAKRVTELLGFEDEVLINFIYGLLDGKNVNGKEIQISITGFMEKNTGKFMKELWTLLLSAQKNASGVPQQLLDEKEEETKMKKADAERITNEIQRKKEREAEESALSQLKMEGGPGTSRTNATSDKLFANHRNGREPGDSPDERKEIAGRNGRARKSRLSRSSHSTESSLSPSWRSNSRSPKARKRSISTERERPYRRRSMSPLYPRASRRSPSLSRRRSSYRRRSRSRSHSRSLSPQRFRSFRHTSPHARRRRSPSPVLHRSPSPVRRRSPLRRSPSPVRRRSPLRRSPSPVRRRSPPRRSRRSPSPVRRRSLLRRSRSPVRRISRALARRQSHSPVSDRSPLLTPRRGSTSPSQGASPAPKDTYLSPQKRRSPSPSRHRVTSTRRRRPPSPITHGSRSQKSPTAYRYRHQSPDSRKHSPSDGKQFPSDQSASVSPNRRLSASPSREKSSTHLKKPMLVSSIENHRLERKSHWETNFNRENESKNPNNEALSKDISLKNTLLSSESSASRARHPEDELRALNSSIRKESKILKESPPQGTEEIYSAQGEREIRETFTIRGSNAVLNEKGAVLSEKYTNEKGAVLSEKYKMEDGGHYLKPENVSHKPMGKGASSDSGYDDGKKRKHKGSSNRHEVSSDDDSSDTDEMKDAKRRKKKEEKRLRREKRRQRHEEKRRKKEEKRSEKNRSRKDDDLSNEKTVHNSSDVEEEEEEKKKQLEMDLRKKALESLKAKKGFGQ